MSLLTRRAKLHGLNLSKPITLTIRPSCSSDTCSPLSSVASSCVSENDDPLSIWSPPLTPTGFEEDYVAPLSPTSVRELQRKAFACLTEDDFAYVSVTSHLLTLRDSDPARCAAEAMELISDQDAPRCWRARAGVYRAEALWKLGWAEEARRELRYARMILEHGDQGGECYALMEALVSWNIHVGRMNWGDDAIVSPVTEPSISKALMALDLSVST